MRVDLQLNIGKAMLEPLHKGKQKIAHGQLGSTDGDSAILVRYVFPDNLLSLSHLLAGMADLAIKALTLRCQGNPLL